MVSVLMLGMLCDVCGYRGHCTEGSVPANRAHAGGQWMKAGQAALLNAVSTIASSFILHPRIALPFERTGAGSNALHRSNHLSLTWVGLVVLTSPTSLGLRANSFDFFVRQ
eukprot:scaffold264156_cov20-Tisochrysis_lutea.AAC.2